MHEKLLTLDRLKDVSRTFHAARRRVVLCHGTFDLLHMGHIRHLQRARSCGDVLIVTVTADRYVNKGPGRPVFSEQLRAESLAALACVDYVAINPAATAVNVIEAIRPSVYVKGSDYRDAQDDVTGNIVAEQHAVERVGGTIHFTDEITFSSSRLLNEYFGVLPPETKDYLAGLKRRYQNGDIIGMLKGLERSRVLVFGDAIVDEYHYTTALGQTGKGNVLAVRYDARERFAGGALAVANHVAGFARAVTLVTCLGEQASYESWIRGRLRPRITPCFFFRDDAPTVVKRRYVDGDMAKLFEVYFYNERPVPPVVENQICDWLSHHAGGFDAVIVPDFGNGLITEKMIDVLCETAQYLAVNTQLNSGNRGYHVITRYPRVDFVALNEPELRLAAHDKFAPLEALAERVGETVGARHVAVTLGTRGMMFNDRCDRRHWQVPALATQVVDRIGAGDALLAVTGLCLAGGVPPAVAAFAGSVAAALEVQTVCNRDSVDPVLLFKYIGTLLK